VWVELVAGRARPEGVSGAFVQWDGETERGVGEVVQIELINFASWGWD